MSPDNVKLVQDSFAKVVPIAGAAADRFYDRLFAIAPEVRRLFPNDLTEQKKKLIGMLATAVTNLHQVEKVMPAIRNLGRRHANYGVSEQHFDVVGEALLWTLETGLGEHFTAPVRAAWTEAYLTVAGVMKDAMKEAAMPRAKAAA